MGPFGIYVEEEETETTAEIEKKAETFLEQARSFEIKTDDHLNDVATKLQDIAGAKQRVEDHYESMRKTTHAAWQDVLSNIKFYSKPLKEAEGIYKKKISDYSIEKERERQQEAKRLRDEARKNEEDRRLEVAEKTGNEKILDMPIFVPEVKVEVAAKPQGISYVEDWQYEVLNEADIPDEYKMIDHGKLARTVKINKENTDIPGICVYDARGVRIARRK